MEYKYWLANVKGIRKEKIRRLLNLYGSARGIYEQKSGILEKLPWLTEEDAARICLSKKEWNLKVRKEELEKKKIRLVTEDMEEFPARLKEIPDAPYALYLKGQMPDCSKVQVAIVGARKCSEYGQEMAFQIAETLGRCGAGIVSGMAAGIDACAHRGARSAGAHTTGVLGCGVDVCYPRENRELYIELEQYGGILSEYPPGSRPLAAHFPARNRLISGLCKVTAVIEARERSGSLITADFALEQGRDVYALPGRCCDPLSYGCNSLIRQGAGLILSPRDFVLELGLSPAKKGTGQENDKKSLEKEELLVYSGLDLYPKSLEEITIKTGLSITDCVNVLASLQHKGYVSETFKNYYRKFS